MPKINCQVCGLSKRCTIVSSHRTEYHDQHGIDWVTKARVKILKHRKGDRLCKGSDKIIHVSCLEDAELQTKYRYRPN